MNPSLYSLLVVVRLLFLTRPNDDAAEAISCFGSFISALPRRQPASYSSGTISLPREPPLGPRPDGDHPCDHQRTIRPPSYLLGTRRRPPAWTSRLCRR